jgi:hypothetical protein
MTSSRREVLRVFGVALALFPLCLAAWYFAAAAIDWLPSRLASPAIGAAAGKVVRIEPVQRNLAYVVEVEGPYRPGSSNLVEARVEVPVATYTYGIAIFAALALAVRGWRRPGRLALGAAILLVIPAFGVTFDALRQLGAAPGLAPLLGWKGGAREAIALGYQVGSLLLPTLAPIITWLVLYPEVTTKPAKPGSGPGQVRT